MRMSAIIDVAEALYIWFDRGSCTPWIAEAVHFSLAQPGTGQG